ncbi:sugar ABC transporter substrate-binding protein [Nocardioides sp. zg-1308]|uniref:Sugar ABC transporter substrate-binding protein n=1 Tax=Nocardioides renjunii TaxID=3095075 RepID=A0ABU5K9S1_9ACTN|nr:MULTISPECIES: sugar ABC transporter substrate-binding protein [unclassified Nocardioides]MDZ5661723.1 sugar ABC transporter substrate-binding protein [Nocardioides sp. S-58]NPD06575.1 sugar ABC transporter substrate-binding protein [Nocardioides sp. zg-1308]WQQ23966.1 sugar ABC transporter substrate-binding protein [Nocardioides sp. S-34]
MSASPSGMPTSFTLSRRALLGGLGGVAASSALSSCGGFSRPESSGGGGGDTLRFKTWASDAEKSAFTRLVKAFNEAEGVTVELEVVPYAEMFTGIDTELQAGSPPDVFRVDYPTLGTYSSTDQLLDLSDQLEGDLTDDLIPALYQAVQYDGTPFGVPHQTDTTAVVYQPRLLREAGITGVPDSLDSAWTWEEFATVSDQLRASLPDGVFPFAYDWQQLGAYRWLTWLFEADGRLLGEDLRTPEIVSAEGRKALEFTRQFLEKGWVPPNTSVKGATYPDTAFASQKVAMAFVGDFLLPSMETTIGDGFEWQVTYQPRDVRASTDLGGNALVAAAATENADLAATFLRFMVDPDNMRTFCEETTELPTRQSLVDTELDFAVRPDLMPTFVEQATTLTPDDVAQVTVPFFAEINTVLQNELELCFVDGQSVDDTLTNIADALESAAG